MKFNTSNIKTKATVSINNPQDETKEVADKPKAKQSFRFNKNTSVEKKQAIAPAVPSEKENTNPQERVVNASPTTQEWHVNRILPKFVNKSANADRGSAIEFSRSAFNLGKKDAKGVRDSLEGKMLLNFWTFDKKTNKQLDLVPTYIDLSEWLNICHMITSGRLHDKTAEARATQQAKGYRYCSWIYQNYGGTTSSKPTFKKNGAPYGGDGPKAILFKITPGMKEDSWLFSSEVYEGEVNATGLIEMKKGTQCAIKVQLLFSYDDLVRIARMSEMAIQAHFCKI